METYGLLFGLNPEVLTVDQIYGNRKTAIVKERVIRSSRPNLGRAIDPSGLDERDRKLAEGKIRRSKALVHTESDNVLLPNTGQRNALTVVVENLEEHLRAFPNLL